MNLVVVSLVFEITVSESSQKISGNLKTNACCIVYVQNERVQVWTFFIKK
jgi:hypothetical protein